jgi:hypothetical protein
MVACCIKRLNRERIKKFEKKYYLNRIILVNEFLSFFFKFGW